MREITRTVTVNDLNPSEMAIIFAQYGSDEQAQFFHHLQTHVKNFGGTGWCGQCSWIADEITPEGREVITKLNEWCGDGGKIAAIAEIEKDQKS